MTPTITWLMIKKHKQLVKLLNDFKDVKNKYSKKTSQLFARLSNELKRHFIIEENIISYLKPQNENNSVNLFPIAEAIKIEHDNISRILDNISESIKTNGKINTYNLYPLLKRHRNIEERLFYPKLDAVLPEKEKNKIYDKIGIWKKI